MNYNKINEIKEWYYIDSAFYKAGLKENNEIDQTVKHIMEHFQTKGVNIYPEIMSALKNDIEKSLAGFTRHKQNSITGDNKQLDVKAIQKQYLDDLIEETEFLINERKTAQVHHPVYGNYTLSNRLLTQSLIIDTFMINSKLVSLYILAPLRNEVKKDNSKVKPLVATLKMDEMKANSDLKVLIKFFSFDDFSKGKYLTGKLKNKSRKTKTRIIEYSDSIARVLYSGTV